jgi:hypothetical protein
VRILTKLLLVISVILLIGAIFLSLKNFFYPRKIPSNCILLETFRDGNSNLYWEYWFDFEKAIMKIDDSLIFYPDRNFTGHTWINACFLRKIDQPLYINNKKILVANGYGIEKMRARISNDPNDTECGGNYTYSEQFDYSTNTRDYILDLSDKEGTYLYFISFFSRNLAQINWIKLCE